MIQPFEDLPGVILERKIGYAITLIMDAV